MPIKHDRKKMIDRLDRQASHDCREKAKGICQICGEVGTETHHLYSRRHLSTRWDQRNLFWVCHECHQWTHAHPEDFHTRMWIDMGKRAYEELREKALQITHYRTADLAELLERLRHGG